MPFVRYTRACLDAASRWPPADRPWSGALRPRVKSIPLFEPRVVDRFLARAHPITPIVWFGPFIAVAFYKAVVTKTLVLALALFAMGWLVWSLAEYLLHRFVFHFEAHTPEQRLRGFLSHGYHHEFPDDATRLVAPPLMSWPIGLVAAVTLHAALGPGRWLPAFAGMATGYIAYDWIHYYTHHFRPRRGIGKWLRSYHMLHHFDDRGTRFGVSSPLWDLVFGTYRPLPRKPVTRLRPRNTHDVILE